MLIIGVAQIVISRVYRCCHQLLLPCRANNWRLLSVFIIALSGCSSVPTPVVTPTAPLHYVQAETWRSIDEQILNASVSARKKSDAYARVAMDNWRRRVHRRTEEVFIPWYSNYWTQQWMASRVAWYKMQYVEGEPTPEERLTSYLQQQFYEQVLEPVSHFFDPRTVMEEATAVYLREIKIRVDKFPHEYQIPVAELNRHLKFIPAIVVQTIPSQDVSLYDVLKITDLFDLPAVVHHMSKQIEYSLFTLDPTGSGLF